MIVMHARALLPAAVLALALCARAQTEPATEPADPTTGPQTATAPGGRGGGGAPPADLRALLTPAPGEMRMVTSRYNTDRTSLSRFYEVPANRNLTRAAGAAAAPTSESISVTRIARMKRFEMDWAEALDKVDAKLSPTAQTELATLKNNVQANLKQLDAQAASIAQIMPLLPFAPAIIKLEEARRNMDSMEAEKAAVTLDRTIKQIAAFRAQFEASLSDPTKPSSIRYSKATVNRAIGVVDGLQATLKEWYDFYYDYDPMFTWWMPNPQRDIIVALAEYAVFLKNKVLPLAPDQLPDGPAPAPIAAGNPPAWSDVPDLRELIAFPFNELADIEQRFGGGGGGGRGGGRGGRTAEQSRQWLAALGQLDFDHLSRNAQVDYLRMRNTLDTSLQRAAAPADPPVARKIPDERLNGQALIAPVGRKALQMGLAEEMIPYTPEELIAIAEVEFKWCDSELLRCARDLGLGDDAREAMERSKDNHVPPGKQPDMIRDILRFDVDFLRKKDLISVPEIDFETIRMQMMTAQRQLVNPYFTGGSEISVSYPLSSMTTEQRVASMKGNNHGIALATVHHELIPGHNLTWYLGPRYRPARAGELGSTPFFNEGWAVYWEMRFYDMGVPTTPEDRGGFIFWRMMRSARIVFSLKYHLGLMSGHECVDYLVDRVYSERENAAAEVTRSFNGSYAPLYQAGYLLGAIQFRSLHKELVVSGQMTERQFHDAIMQQPQMPVSLIRLALGKDKLARDQVFDWKFYGPNPGK